MQKCDLCVGEVHREEGPPCVAACCPGKALSLVAVSTGEKADHQKKITAWLGSEKRGST